MFHFAVIAAINFHDNIFVKCLLNDVLHFGYMRHFAEAFLH